MNDGLRTGADYRAALRRDGRNVWVLGDGKVEDVTAHPATRGMVEEYARHCGHADLLRERIDGRVGQ